MRFILLALPFLAGCTPGMPNGYGHGMGGYGFMGFGIIFWIVAFIIVVAGLLMVFSRKPNDVPLRGEEPMVILERRYANGEIDEEEFARRKKFLTGGE